jgi:rod shape-determining protein MreC
MKTMRRPKRAHYGSQIAFVFCVVAGAWLLRQTQGAAIAEIYHLLISPFLPPTNQVELLKNARIQELEARLGELEKQNKNLQQLLGYVKKQQGKVIVAPVIGRSADYWWQQFTIGRGSADGIKEGFVVTGIGGLVGKITNVTPHTSRVLLISDPTSRVGVTMSRTRYLGVIQGQGSTEVIMRFFDKVSDVKVGDLVTTSSVSQIFPAGFPVGKVKSINLNTGPAPEAIIELTSPLSYLEWVVIHPH